VLFAVLAALLLASRLCHVGILWEGDTLPLATAQQMLRGKVIYRDVWFDKPPLVPVFHLLASARHGWPLRVLDALYALLCCAVAYLFARDRWSKREGLWAAALLGFYLIFDFPSAVIPVASDLLMLAPHLAAVWLASQRRPFWSGVAAGIAFWISPKALLVLAVCALWDFGGLPLLGAGFAAVCAVAVAWLGASRALGAYWKEVWIWGRIYAGNTFLANPVRNGIIRTADWLGFHSAAVVGAAYFLWKRPERIRLWIAWLLISLAGVALGMRFFPRYYFQLLPLVALMAARGFVLLSARRRELAALLVLIPLTRFGPPYLAALRNPLWRDAAMDHDSRAAAAMVRSRAKPGDTLFVWGYRPEIYVYTGMPAATMYLDSQPLTGVPADRHLTQSEPVERIASAMRRSELTRARPTFVLDGLGLYNPNLAIGHYPDLRQWLSLYREVGRSGATVIYELRAGHN
jgi:hypothetical protein